MVEALRFFRAYEVWIYLVIGLGAVVYLRKFTLAWGELRNAAFGLERQTAQGKLNQAASALALLLALFVTEFVLVAFIAPATPGAIPIPTPTIDLTATAAPSLAVTPAAGSETPLAESATALTGTPGAPAGCTPGQVMIAEPQDGGEISDVVTVKGSAQIENFGFYKLEMKRAEETAWLTILAGNQPVVDDTLGLWNTSLLSPGDHQLSLVVSDNQGNSLPPCVIQVRVVSPVTPQP
ncbi:MAG: hypothetical protein L0Z70_11920 [Chloroflexi bacterium]|nr:hypothetical protein [Chloroflexota bacterium]